jgi:hypothetical protein
MKAQIFLSCGQNSEERPIAETIKKKIEGKNEEGSELGFDCFVASEEQNLDGLRDIIFRHLEESDYFIFIDFKRERLIGDSLIDHIFPQFLLKKRFCRGSLYANQELAVASYLRFADNILLLQEEGIEERGGMLSAVLANLKEDKHTFSSSEREKLPEKIYGLIKAKLNDTNDNKRWTNQTRNTLALNVYQVTEPVLPRPFHISVDNLHHRKDARNCFAYLDEVINLDTGQKVGQTWETVEFKWANTRLASVRIAPKAHRIFDAFWLIPTKTGIETKFFYFPFPSSTDYFPHKLGFGRYRLTFSVISDNFARVQKSFNFDFKPGQSINDASASWITANRQTN